MDEYDVKVQNYKGSMDFYAYSFDFCAKGQISSVLEKKSQEYDGSSVSEQDEGFMFDIDL